jgi:hypothetical protein
MKTNLIYFLLFTTMAINAQTAIGLQVSQDLKLAVKILKQFKNQNLCQK